MPTGGPPGSARAAATSARASGVGMMAAFRESGRYRAEGDADERRDHEDDDERRERAHERERHRGQHDEGQARVAELREEDGDHAEQPEAEHAREVAERLLLRAILAAELARVALGQREVAQALSDVGGDRADVAALAIGRDDDRGAEVLAQEDARRGRALEGGDGRE